MGDQRVPEEARKEIERLVADLNYHNYRYHVLDEPVISDREYDTLYRRLSDLEQAYSYVLPDSPTQRVGAPPADRFRKVSHSQPMLSLDNAFSYEELTEFDKRVKRLLRNEAEVEYTVEPKYDGLAIELTYKQGVLSSAATRGDGYLGEDIRNNVITIRSVPLKIEVNVTAPEEIDIRGEVYMNLEDFRRLNHERERRGDPPFANPRNAAAGTVRQLDPSITASRKLYLVCYGVGRASGVEFKSQADFIGWLKEARFPTPVSFTVARGIDEVIEAVRKLQEQRDFLPFETDGAVVKVNDFTLQQQLGFKTREPRWAIAFKFQAHRAATRIREIRGSVGRTGVITPFAVLEPVHIGGVTVSRSTLHNWDEMARKEIKVGDMVVIERAGDVIPHVVMVVKERRTGSEEPFPVPTHCPACGSQVVREEGEVAVRCVSLYCPAQLQEKIMHFASRGGMDIEGLGEKNVALLYSKGLIQHFEDVYRLTREDLLALPRFAEKSAQNLIEAIGRSKQTTQAKFLYAIGIIHVGEYVARLLARNFRHLEDLYGVNPDRLVEIKQLGAKIASSIALFFNDSRNIETMDLLKSLGLKIENPDFQTMTAEKKTLEGLTFVITGALPHPRKEVEGMVEEQGGRVSSSVSGSTDYVVVGDDAGSKLDKARRLGVKTISYYELLRLIEWPKEG